MVILPVIDWDRVCLIKSHRWALDETLYELLTGTLNEGEHPLQAARRELKEETGYHADTWEEWANLYTSPGTLDERMHLFVATDLTPGPKRSHGYQKLGFAYHHLGNPDQASECFQKAWKIDHPSILLRQEIARDWVAFLNETSDGKAIERLREAILLGPEGRAYLSDRLARILATCSETEYRDPVEAIRLANCAVRLTRQGDIDAIETLVYAYLAADFLEEAEEWLDYLLQGAKRSGERARIDRARELLKQLDQKRSGGKTD